MDKDNCIIYIGASFTIEWYYRRDGRSQAYEHFLKLGNDQRRKFFILIKRLSDAGRINDTTKFRYEGDKIYALKPQPDRFLCFFFKGRKVIVTNAFTKHSQKLPVREKQRSIECKIDYENRMEEIKDENDI